MRSCIFVVLAVVGANVVASSESEIKLICDKARQSVAIVETTAGTGSGFVTQFQDGKKYFVTNRHVVENASKVTAVAIDGGEVLLGRFQYASNDFDLVRFAVSSDAKALEMASCVPSFGDALFVVGNSDGVGVATCIEGKLRGIGADRFELSAKFICGNSGSPVLNSRGQVVGVATYALLHNDPENWLLQDSSFNAVRRFGLRLDGVKWISDDFEAFCAKQKIKREEEAKAKEMSIAQRQMATLNNYLQEYMHASREEQTPEEVLQAVRKTKGSYCQFTDRWGVDYKFSIVSNTAYLASAGIDRTFETPDDIVLTNNCAFPVGVLSLEARREEEKYQRQISSAREIARAIKCVTGLSLREHCDLHQVECDRVKIGHIEFLTSGYRRCGQQTLFNAVFPVCKVSFTAKSGLVFAIQLRTGKTGMNAAIYAVKHHLCIDMRDSNSPYNGM